MYSVVLIIMESSPLNEFSFDDVAVSETEYTGFIDDLESRPYVNSLKHSPALNEIIVYLDAEFDGEFSIEREDITIEEVTQDTIEDVPVYSVRLRTTRMFSEDDSDIFSADYTDESAVFFNLQLETFEGVDRSTLQRKDDGEMVAVAFLADDVTGTSLFQSIQSTLGYAIERVMFESGRPVTVSFSFDYTTPFTEETPERLQSDKLSRYTRSSLYKNASLRDQEGHVLNISPQMFEGDADAIEESSVTRIDGREYYKVSVDTDRFLTKTHDRNDRRHQESTEKEESEFTSVSIKQAYHCDDCRVMYVPVQMDELKESHEPEFGLKNVSTVFRDGDDRQSFSHSIIDEPLLPIDELH